MGQTNHTDKNTEVNTDKNMEIHTDSNTEVHADKNTEMHTDNNMEIHTDNNTAIFYERISALADASYKEFHSKLMPTVDKNVILGVRTPDLRKLAKEMLREAKTKAVQKQQEDTQTEMVTECDIAAFMETLPHTYYEENNLHGFFIEAEKDYDVCIKKLDAFLPYIDNWATCDLISPKVVKKYPERFLEKIQEWMASEAPYTKRFGIGMLMRHYLDDYFVPEYLAWVADIRSEEYYVNMMVAWYFATALAKQYDEAVGYIEKQKLDTWTHNKAIQKAVESYRVTEEQKSYLRTLRRSAETKKRN